MDLADIPAAAALLGADLGADSHAHAAISDSQTTATNLLDLSNQSIHSMESNPAAAAAALMGAVNLYPPHMVEPSMAHNYYAQNFPSIASTSGGYSMPYGFGVMPMPLPMAPFMGAGPSGGLVAPSLVPSAVAYDVDAQALQHQMVAHFSQSTPGEQTTYYEGVRQQLHAATSGLSEQQRKSLLQMDPTLSFSMKPLDLDHPIDNAQVCSTASTPRGPKRARTGSTIKTEKKPRKSKASSCEPSPGGLLTDDSGIATAASSATTTPRSTTRGRPPKVSAAAAAASAGIELTPSGKKKSMTRQAEEMRARKAKMTWPKGTFIIRLGDIKKRNGKDHIWLIDNHQLLQRFNNESGGVLPDGSRVYTKTDRYTGWLCNDGYHYFPLFDHKHILNNDGSKVTVMFPEEHDLKQAIDYEEQETNRRLAMRDMEDEESSQTRVFMPKVIRDGMKKMEDEGDVSYHSLMSPSDTVFDDIPSTSKRERRQSSQWIVEEEEDDQGGYREVNAHSFRYQPMKTKKEDDFDFMDDAPF